MGTYNDKQYDEMKEIFSRIRSFSKKNRIIEGYLPALQPEEEADEKQRFINAVTQNVQFGEFIRTNDNITWYGLLVKEKIAFTYSLDSTIGCFISCKDTQLTDDTVKVFQNLKSYYDEWSKYWGTQISLSTNER
jgi:hypothetical protein